MNIRSGNGGAAHVVYGGLVYNLNPDPVDRVDLRLQERVPLHARAALSGYLEIFNLFNRANYGAYEVRENNAAYGQPQATTNLSYAPRTLQLGFRLTF